MSTFSFGGYGCARCNGSFRKEELSRNALLPNSPYLCKACHEKAEKKP